MAVTFKIDGLKPVLERLKKLRDEEKHKAVRTAMRAGANIVRKAAIANASAIDDPNTPERIADKIRVQYAPKLSKRVGGVAMRVGVLGGAREKPDTNWYWRFVEFGVPSHGIPARPFMLSALEDNSEAVMEAIAKSMDRAITRLIARGAP